MLKRKVKMRNEVEGYLSKENTNAIKGIMAILIVLIHVYAKSDYYFPNTLLHFICYSLMPYMTVTIFFFISGYGLMNSYIHKGDEYIRNFPRQRLLPFYCKYIFFVLIYLIFRITTHEGVVVSEILTSLTWGGTIVKYGWYLQTILILYIVFWIIFSINVDDRMKIVFTFMLMVVLWILCVQNSVTQTWFVTTPGFLLGIIWCKYKRALSCFFATKRKRIGVFCCMLMLCGIVWIIGTYIPVPYNSVFKVMFTSIFLTVAIMQILMGISFNNFITAYLGKISLEIYAFHGVFVELCSGDFFQIYGIWGVIIVVLVCTLIVASIVHPLLTMLDRWVKND